MNNILFFLTPKALCAYLYDDFTLRQALEKMERGEQSLFNQCVTNLSNEAAFALVADMSEVVKEPEYWAAYLPAFVLENAVLFKPFILSAQLSLHQERPSHMWVLTYKH